MKEFVPREYQHLIYDHIVKNKRCSVFAGMGLGKGVSTLWALDDLSLVEDIYPVLVLGPKRVAKRVWSTEAAKWSFSSDLDVSVIVGEEEERLAAMHSKAQIYTLNYDVIPWFIEQLDGKWPFKTIVADEQTKLKNYRLKQGGKRAGLLGKYAFKSKRYIGLTGTPAGNGLSGLWGQMFFVDQGRRLGNSFSAFEDRWFRMKRDGYGLEALPYAQEEIQNRIKDICLYIDPADYFDLQKPIVNDIYIDLPDHVMTKYKQLEKEFYTEIENVGIEAFNAGVKSNKLSQFANGAIYIDDERNWKEIHKEKLEALEEIVEEANGMPIVVAYEFVSDKERIMKHFPKAQDLSKDKGLNAFMTGKYDMGICHPASLGHGVDGLQDVTNIIAVFGHSWDLELYDQLMARIGPVRQLQSGHNRPVFIHHIIARRTVDELKMERRDTKRSVQEILLNAMKGRKS